MHLDSDLEPPAESSLRADLIPFRRAVEAFFRQKREAAAIEEYIQGYLKRPETQEELGWVEAASQGVLAEYPWDEKAEQ